MPRWIGGVYDSTLAAPAVAALLALANPPGQPVRWVACGAAPALKRCSLRDFPAIATASEPRIRGDRAQILVSVWYRSSIDAHPNAWFVNVLYLKRVGGRWTRTHGFNLGAT